MQQEPGFSWWNSLRCTTHRPQGLSKWSLYNKSSPNPSEYHVKCECSAISDLSCYIIIIYKLWGKSKRSQGERAWPHHLGLFALSLQGVNFFVFDRCIWKSLACKVESTLEIAVNLDDTLLNDCCENLKGYRKLDFPGGSVGKGSSCSVGGLSLIPGLGTSPGEGKGTHSSILAWRIPWTGGLHIVHGVVISVTL